MKILEAQYVKGRAESSSALEESIPEICFVGRSNVGKSSLINRLLMRKLARTSSTPGATRFINTYKIHYEFLGVRRWLLLSDFPGFGYARVARQTREKWEELIERYLIGRKALRRLVWIYDVRRDFDDLDQTMLEWVRDRKLPLTLVLTKIDKESLGYGMKKKAVLEQRLGGHPVFMFSSKDGYGGKELLSHLLGLAGG
jgi:GTP-binding protein